jgi:hypothetical protein
MAYPGSQNGLSSCSHDGGEIRDKYRLEWLARLLGVTVKGLKLELYPSHDVVWVDEQAYKREVREVRGLVRSSYNKLVSRFLEKGLLSSSEAMVLRPNISLKICDNRKDGSVKLPDVVLE